MKLGEYKKRFAEFKKAAEGAEAIGKIARERNDKCWRTTHIVELAKWDEKKGFITKEATWRKCSCSSHPLLPWMVKKGMVHGSVSAAAAEVLLELEDPQIRCIRYSEATLGKFPETTTPWAREYFGTFSDVLYDYEDLLLGECYVELNVRIEAIKKIYIAEDAEKEVKTKAEEFARKHGIPLEAKFPAPPPDVAEKIEKLSDYLRKRPCTYASDPIFSALAEEYDKHAFGAIGLLGASDAMEERIKRDIPRFPKYKDCLKG